MENSAERGRDSYTNCCLFDQVIKVYLKCLGAKTPLMNKLRVVRLEDGLPVESARATRIKRPPRPPECCGAGA